MSISLLAALWLAGADYHSSPACWPTPRYTQHPADAALDQRLQLSTEASTADLAEGSLSPNGGYRYVWQQLGEDWQLLVDTEQHRRLRLQLTEPAYPPTSRWINEKLIFVRSHWGRQLGSDLIVDVERGAVIYHEALREGSLAFEQYRQACGGQCPCPEGPESESAVTSVTQATPPSSNDPDEDGLRLTGLVRPGGEPLDALLLYAAPSVNASRIAANGSALRQREASYETPALSVYGRRPGWLRLRLKTGVYVWAEARELGEFLPYRALIADRLQHLAADWDGRLWDQPGGVAQSAAAAGEQAVELLELRRVDGRLWARVGLYERSPCEGGDGTLRASGWVAVHDATGEPLLWYWSRGC